MENLYLDISSSVPALWHGDGPIPDCTPVRLEKTRGWRQRVNAIVLKADKFWVWDGKESTPIEFDPFTRDEVWEWIMDAMA